MDDPPLLAIYAVAARRRHRHRLRQPGPPRRSWSRWCPRSDMQQRGQPQQRADDRRPGSSARRWPACSSPPSASAGLPRSTASPTSPCSSASGDEPPPSCARRPSRPRARARCGRGSATPAASRAVGPAGDDGRHRHARLQLPDRASRCSSPATSAAPTPPSPCCCRSSASARSIGALATARRNDDRRPRRSSRTALGFGVAMVAADLRPEPAVGLRRSGSWSASAASRS